MIADDALLSKKHDKQLKEIIDRYVATDEEIIVALRGVQKEYLVATDKQVYIIKKGFMTGHLFGHGVMKLPYKAITSVNVDMGLLTGYFELSAAGIENKKLPYITSQKGASSSEAPNAISINRTLLPEFEKAVAIINRQIHAA